MWFFGQFLFVNECERIITVQVYSFDLTLSSAIDMRLKIIRLFSSKFFKKYSLCRQAQNNCVAAKLNSD